MAILIALIIFVLIGAVVLLVGAPLRAPRGSRAAGGGPSVPSSDPPRQARLAELRAEREAKYREIRDAEMDFRTGKLSEPDYRELDGELRAEALHVLDALRELGAETDRAAEPPAGGS